MTIVAKTAFSLGAAAIVAAAAHAGPFTVESNKTKPLYLNSDAASVVIGNEGIANVAVHNEKLLFITGKTFGTTNLMVFAADGTMIYSSDVVVTSNSANLVTVNRAGENYTYDCAPSCRGVISVGDAPEQYNRTFEQVKQLQELNE